MQLLMSGGQPGVGGGQGVRPPGMVGQPQRVERSISVTAEEMAAVDRLVELGFNK